MRVRLLALSGLAFVLVVGCRDDGLGKKCGFTRDCLAGLVCDLSGATDGSFGVCKKPRDVTPFDAGLDRRTVPQKPDAAPDVASDGDETDSGGTPADAMPDRAPDRAADMTPADGFAPDMESPEDAAADSSAQPDSAPPADAAQDRAVDAVTSPDVSADGIPPDATAGSTDTGAFEASVD